MRGDGFEAGKAYSIEEIEADGLKSTREANARRAEKGMTLLPDLPFALGQHRWEKFKALIQPGDEVVWARSVRGPLNMREGWQLERGGIPVAFYLTGMA